jgi:branched-chain amino acid transport system permease protein
MLTHIGVWSLVIALLAVAPIFATKSESSILFFLLMWICLSQSFNLFTGLTGYVNFGNVVFYGIGGYAGALAIIDFGASPLVGVLLGGVLSALFAFVLSFPTLRLRGAYFAIATVTVQQATFVIFDNWGFVNSATGLTLPIESYNPTLQYYTMLAIAISTMVAIYAVTRSRLGRALLAIRQQEEAAVSIGINSTFYKTLAFTLSGFFAGLGGGTAIWSISIIDPPSAFDTTITLSVIAMALLGGVGTLLGPVLGAIILYSTDYFLRIQYPYLHLMISGAIIIVVVLIVPEGLVGFVRRRLAGRRT